jgi:hypothetical protein
MSNRPSEKPPTLNTPNAPKPAQQGPRDSEPKLGREQPGEGLDTGVDTGAIQPGASGDASPLD